MLSRSDLYAEKLLANADRWSDRGVASRDAIDLAMMVDGWGPVPGGARDKAVGAYGGSIDRSFEAARGLLHDPVHLARCLAVLEMDVALAPRIAVALDDPV